MPWCASCPLLHNIFFHTPHSWLLLSKRPQLLSTVRSPKTPSLFSPKPTLPASDLLFPEKTQLLAFPLHSDESQCSFLVTLKADIVTFVGEWLIPNPNLNCVTMHNQPNSHYVGPNFSLFSLVTNNWGRRLIKAGIRARFRWCQLGQSK